MPRCARVKWNWWQCQDAPCGVSCAAVVLWPALFAANSLALKASGKGVWRATAGPGNAFQIIEGPRRPSLTDREENRPAFPQLRWRRSFIGSEAFRKELLAQVSQRAGLEHCGKEIEESAEAKPQRLVAEELKESGWTELELGARRRGHPAKVATALRLRQETTMTLSWIAERLWMTGELTILRTDRFSSRSLSLAG